MFVFRECSKFTSVFTLCALSVDRFMATFHQLGRYRQIRVGVAVCTSIWVACLVVSSPYWIFGSTAERTRRTPPATVATGSDVIAQTGNTTTAHALGSAYNDYLLASHADAEFDQEYDLVGGFDLDPGGDLNYDDDLEPEKAF